MCVSTQEAAGLGGDPSHLGVVPWGVGDAGDDHRTASRVRKVQTLADLAPAVRQPMEDRKQRGKGSSDTMDMSCHMVMHHA